MTRVLPLPLALAALVACDGSHVTFPADTGGDTDVTDTDTDTTGDSATDSGDTADTGTWDTDTPEGDGFWTDVTAGVFSPTGGPLGAYGGNVAAQGQEVAIADTFGLDLSHDGGRTWSRSLSFDATGVQAYVVGFADDGLFVGSRYAGVWLSTDQGGSWTDVSAGLGGADVELIATDGAGAVYALVMGGMGLEPYRWNGASWDVVNAPTSFGSMVVRGDEIWGAASYIGDSYYSADGGASWTAGAVGGPAILSEAAVLDDGAIVGVDFSGNLQRSEDDGATFATVGALPSFTTSVDTYDGVYYALTQNDGVFRSDDGGKTWTSTVSDKPIGYGRWQMGMARTDDGFVSTVYGYGAYRSDDGLSWSLSNDGLHSVAVWGLAANGDDVIAGTALTAAWHLDDGVDWATRDVGLPTDSGVEVVGAGDGVLFAETRYKGSYRSTDHGATWTSMATGWPTYNGTAGEQPREAAAFDVRGTYVFAALGWSEEYLGNGSEGPGSTGGGVVRSKDLGLTWERVVDGLSVAGHNAYNEAYFAPMQTVKSFSDVVLLGTYGDGAYRSTDRGDTWKHVSGLPSGEVVSAFAELGDDLYLGAAGYGTADTYGVWRSTDRGATWTRVSTGLPADCQIKGMVSADGVLFALVFGIDSGLYRIDGDTWSLVADAGVDDLSGPLVIYGDRMFAGTLGDGVVEFLPEKSNPY